ncbi:GNAT family N-acetyltransferase [Micromonospora sp. NPDC049559]|uniref:GNAT family N-acetyltransferase n=1 Tax=Micromonospora sp. NPDC049559 TaxID=3155923 RepID=UPI0034383767
MLRRQDVGHRVVVRRIVGISEGRTQFSDTLGELVELSETHLTVATGKGELRVPLAEVHRAKRVPAARRPVAGAVVDLELAANEAWPAPVQDRLGGWLLRAADGWTGRGNSALPVGDPDRPLPAAIDAVESWYAARGLPARINVPLPLAGPVGVALDERGWRAQPPVLVQTASLAALLDRMPHRADLPTVELLEEPSDAWLALVAARKSGPDRPANRLPEAALRLLTAVPTIRFAHVYASTGGQELLAVARGTVTGQRGRWLGLTLLEVVPAARRRGLALHVLRALTRWAAGLGATDAFLQVEEHNAAAVALYRRLGFTTHHTYVSRVAPD